jgi:hypothetical protein
MESKFETALDIIEDLLETISWLGGDAYEMEATKESRNTAYDFINLHRSRVESTIGIVFDQNIRMGLYCLKSDENITVKAMNRKIAAKYLGVGKKSIKVIEVPK